MKLNISRMHNRIRTLANIGKTPQGGSRRIALTEDDKLGRDLLVDWMKETGLEVLIDEIGNIFGVLKGDLNTPPIMIGSHIDTVCNGGHLDGCYGVIAGLEVIATYVDYKQKPRQGLCVAIFTNEEGVRFQPDMLGSLVYAHGMAVDTAYKIKSTDEKSLKEELERIDYLGSMKCGSIVPYAFLELHIEQGPILDKRGITIGAVDSVQGISWSKVIFKGQANHAGTTPMNMRRDAAFAAARLTIDARGIANKIGPSQVATVGVITPKPNLINVVPGEVQMTVDLRNSDEGKLQKAEAMLQKSIEGICKEEDVTSTFELLVRFEPVQFDSRISNLISNTAEKMGLSSIHMTSGAGHDAQMMARICPAAMIFVPSKDGVSHNPKEHTNLDDLNAGAEILFQVILTLDQGYLS